MRLWLFHWEFINWLASNYYFFFFFCWAADKSVEWSNSACVRACKGFYEIIILSCPSNGDVMQCAWVQVKLINLHGRNVRDAQRDNFRDLKKWIFFF